MLPPPSTSSLVALTQFQLADVFQTGDLFFFLSYSWWHTLPSHASAEACLTGWPNAQPKGGTSVG